MKDSGHAYFLRYLESEAEASPEGSHAQAAFVLAVICDNHPKGRVGPCLLTLPALRAVGAEVSGEGLPVSLGPPSAPLHRRLATLKCTSCLLAKPGTPITAQSLCYAGGLLELLLKRLAAATMRESGGLGPLGAPLGASSRGGSLGEGAALPPPSWLGGKAASTAAAAHSLHLKWLCLGIGRLCEGYPEVCGLDLSQAESAKQSLQCIDQVDCWLHLV